jgi:uncharacterized membrane protein
MITGMLVVAIGAAIGILMVSRQRPITTQEVGYRGTSPLDEAERILAHRYARREVSAEEYERMLNILRR